MSHSVNEREGASQNVERGKRVTCDKGSHTRARADFDGLTDKAFFGERSSGD